MSKKAATGNRQTADNNAQGSLLDTLETAKGELTDALGKIEEVEKELEPVNDPKPVIDAATGQPQTPQPTDEAGNPIPTPDAAAPLDSAVGALAAASPIAPTGTATSAAQATPAPLTTPCPLTLEQFLRQNTGSVNAAVQINDAGDVMLVFVGTDGMPAKIFTIMGELARNVTLLAA